MDDTGSYKCNICGKKVDDEGFRKLACQCGSRILIKLRKSRTKKVIAE